MQPHHAKKPFQSLFRALLAAMSNPGRFQPVESMNHNSPTYTLLLDTAQCLIDHEVSYAFIGPDLEKLTSEITQRTGSLRTQLDCADYIFFQGNHSNGEILKAKRGAPFYPDSGATVIFQIEDDAKESGDNDTSSSKIVLTGPGIKIPFSPVQPGLTLQEYLNLKQINAEYPFGVDTIILRGNDHLMAIPRSTGIKVR